MIIYRNLIKLLIGALFVTGCATHKELSPSDNFHEKPSAVALAKKKELVATLMQKIERELNLTCSETIKVLKVSPQKVDKFERLRKETLRKLKSNLTIEFSYEELKLVDEYIELPAYKKELEIYPKVLRVMMIRIPLHFAMGKHRRAKKPKIPEIFDRDLRERWNGTCMIECLEKIFMNLKILFPPVLEHMTEDEIAEDKGKFVEYMINVFLHLYAENMSEVEFEKFENFLSPELEEKYEVYVKEEIRRATQILAGGCAGSQES